MDYRKIIVPVLAVLSVVSSCKKDETTPDPGKYLSGTLRFTVPSFVSAGDAMKITPHGVSHPELKADSLGYYWTDTMFGVRDTVKKQTDPASSFKGIDFTVGISPAADSPYHNTPKDTLGTFSITVTAYAEGYYSSSSTLNYSVVKDGYGEGTSFPKGFAPSGTPVVIDDWNYYTTQVGGNVWLRQNLCSAEKGSPMDGSPAALHLFGSFYTYEEALTACPAGWKLPTANDWKNALGSAEGKVSGLLADVYFNGTTSDCRLWEYWPEVGKITDATGLSLLPTGWAVVSGGKYVFHDFRQRAVFWTSEADGATNAFAVDIYKSQNEMRYTSFDRETFAAPVRCIQAD